VVNLLSRLIPILLFLLSITVVAELATEAGVFSLFASRLARLARGRILNLYVTVAFAASLITIFLGLDATAVLFTPVVIILARRVEAPLYPFVLLPLLFSNLASLLLPVSNLTNLLSEYRFHLHNSAYIQLSYRSSLVTMVATLLILMIIFRKDLRGRYKVEDKPKLVDPAFTIVATLACLLFAVLILVNVSATKAAVVSAVIVAGGALIRDRSTLQFRLIPLRLLLLVTTLFFLVDLLHHFGINRMLAPGTDNALGTLLWSALAANLINNLPAYLLFEPVVSPHNLFYLLVGVNFGSIVLPWGSLATLLWAHRCKAAGISVQWRKSILISGLMAIIVVPMSAISVFS
jgi:arsenical pump membrane protein